MVASTRVAALAAVLLTATGCARDQRLGVRVDAAPADTSTPDAAEPDAPPCACDGDLNSDGTVGIPDLGQLIGCLNDGGAAGCTDPANDINCDGALSEADLDALRCQYGTADAGALLDGGAAACCASPAGPDGGT